jgi:hypothetical protein
MEKISAAERQLLRVHMCPRRGCPVMVPNSIFCCTPHWWSLPEHIRNGISRTARLNVLNPARRAAIEAARMYWGKPGS